MDSQILGYAGVGGGVVMGRLWVLTLNLKVFSALLEICPYLQNASCIFVDLSYSALMACTIQHLWPFLAR